MVITEGQLVVFILIFGRVMGLFVSAPIFSAQSVNPWLRSALALWISAVLWFVVPINPGTLPLGLGGILLGIMIQVIIGLIMGFTCNIIFVILQATGELADIQMGLSVAQSLDPTFGAVVTILGRLCFFITLAIFLATNGHHMILAAIHQSFTIIPVSASAVNFTNPQIVTQFMDLMNYFWFSSVQLAAPILLLIFLSDFTFGIVSKVAPQVNVFMLGFQVKPLLGLVGLVLIMSFITSFVSNLPVKMGTELLKLLSYLR